MKWIHHGNGEVTTEVYEVDGQKNVDHICNCEVINGVSANADLIAAAPDLLEALQTIQVKMSDFIKLANEVGINDADGFYLAAATDAEEQARAAISKALGEE